MVSICVTSSISFADSSLANTCPCRSWFRPTCHNRCLLFRRFHETEQFVRFKVDIGSNGIATLRYIRWQLAPRRITLIPQLHYFRA